VLDDVVIVAASGRLAGYDPGTGAPRWLHRTGGGSYGSPQLMTIGGVSQVVMVSGDGVSGLAPADGKELWKHSWPGAAILQPAMTEDGGVLIATGDMSGGLGVRRLSVAHGPNGWTADETWTSTGLKPYFNDFVVHNGHAFGFDGGILACIDLQNGKRKWKGGRLRPWPDASAGGSGPAASSIGRRRAGAGGGDIRQIHGDRTVTGASGQDLESSGPGRRYSVGAQRARDGSVPVIARG